jgi:hypothetical protein
LYDFLCISTTSFPTEKIAKLALSLLSTHQGWLEKDELYRLIVENTDVEYFDYFRMYDIINHESFLYTTQSKLYPGYGKERVLYRMWSIE